MCCTLEACSSTCHLGHSLATWRRHSAWFAPLTGPMKKCVVSKCDWDENIFNGTEQEVTDGQTTVIMSHADFVFADKLSWHSCHEKLVSDNDKLGKARAIQKKMAMSINQGVWTDCVQMQFSLWANTPHCDQDFLSPRETAEGQGANQVEQISSKPKCESHVFVVEFHDEEEQHELGNQNRLSESPLFEVQDDKNVEWKDQKKKGTLKFSLKTSLPKHWMHVSTSGICLTPDLSWRPPAMIPLWHLPPNQQLGCHHDHGDKATPRRWRVRAHCRL